LDAQAGDNILAPDPFWDGRSGGLRCSSEGENAARYHDPSTQYLEGNEGRSMAGVMSAGPGIRGVVIPRSTRWGGSRGFDPQKPQLINIDPDIKGQASVIDLSKLNKEMIEEAYAQAIETQGEAEDPYLIASQAFRNLAISTEPVGMSRSSGQYRAPRRAPLPGAYVVPKAGRGGAQVQEQEESEIVEETLVSPSIKLAVAPSQRVRSAPLRQGVTSLRETPKLAPVTPPQELNEVRPKAFLAEKPQAPQRRVQQGPSGLLAQVQQKTPLRQPAQYSQQSAGPPTKKVLFEARGWGQLPYMYHDVVKSDNLLVLVFNNNAANCTKLFPPIIPPNEQDPKAHLLAVQLENDSNIYLVHSTGTKFEHNNYEYYILVVAEVFVNAPDEALTYPGV